MYHHLPLAIIFSCLFILQWFKVDISCFMFVLFKFKMDMSAISGGLSRNHGNFPRCSGAALLLASPWEVYHLAAWSKGESGPWVWWIIRYLNHLMIERLYIYIRYIHLCIYIYTHIIFVLSYYIIIILCNIRLYVSSHHIILYHIIISYYNIIL
jgi:hypothetical protein